MAGLVHKGADELITAWAIWPLTPTAADRHSATTLRSGQGNDRSVGKMRGGYRTGWERTVCEEDPLRADGAEGCCIVRHGRRTRRTEEVVTPTSRLSTLGGEVTVKSIKARLAASSGLIALSSILTVLGAPWKW